MRIVGREVDADIAVRKRAQDRVDHGVKHDVGVGVPLQSAAVGDAYPSQHHVVAVAELVNVEAEPGAYVA